MPDVLPSTLAVYVQQCLQPSKLTLLTSVLNAPANWLTVRFLHAALRGIEPHGEGRGSRSSGNNDNAHTNHHVIFVSLFRPLSLWVEIAKKLGLNLGALFKAKQLLYIDGLNESVLTGTEGGGPSASFGLPSLQLNEIQKVLDSAIRSLKLLRTNEDSTPSNGVRPITIVIDGLDFALASQQQHADADAVSLVQFMSRLRAQTHAAVVLSCNADTPLLHNRDHQNAVSTPLEREHSAFITSVAHQSGWIMQLRGLDTGTARDITGVLRISRGGSYDDEDVVVESNVTRVEDVDDGEWLYQLKGDGSVRVWLRGE